MHTYSPQSRIPLFLCLLLALPAALPVRVQKAESTPTEAPAITQQEEVKPAAEAPAVAVVPRDGFNMKIVDIVDLPEQMTIVTTLDPPVFNWFAGTFTNLPTDKEVTIGLNMTGMDSPPDKADVSKWVGLRPVFTYADPTRYETYEWFQKDEQGRWVSGDPFKAAEEKFAGTGKAPVQNAIPANLAEQFLSEDGKYWQAWKEIEKTEVATGINTFRLKQKFIVPTATVAMRVPYTYTYQQAFIEKLRAAEPPGVKIDMIGVQPPTPQGRKHQVIRIEPPDQSTREEKEQPVIVVYAREHPNEQDGSWAIEGMIRWLLAEETISSPARKSITWLLIPIIDPDAAYKALPKTGDIFMSNPPVLSNAITYATYMINWLDAGHRLDMIICIHNVECNEGKNLECPFITQPRLESVRSYNTKLFSIIKENGFSTGNPAGWDNGILALRFSGWCCSKFRTYDLIYEVNTRNPENRLPIERIMKLGALISDESSEFLLSDDFIAISSEIDEYMKNRANARNEWWKRNKRDAEHRNYFDLLTLGY